MTSVGNAGNTVKIGGRAIDPLVLALVVNLQVKKVT